MKTLPGVASEDDLVERELAALRQGQKSGRSGTHGAVSAYDGASPHHNQGALSGTGTDNIDEMIDIITKKVVPEPRSHMMGGSQSPKGRTSNKKQRGGISNMPPKRFRAEDAVFAPGQFDPETRHEARKLERIAHVMGNMATQVAATENRTSTKPVSPPRAARTMTNRNMSNDFHFGNPPPGYQQEIASVHSQEFASFANDATTEQLALRPHHSSHLKGTGNKRDQLQRVYGNLGDISGFEQIARRSGASPIRHVAMAAPKRGSSGDPRLRGLENIYMKNGIATFNNASMAMGGNRGMHG